MTPPESAVAMHRPLCPLCRGEGFVTRGATIARCPACEARRKAKNSRGLIKMATVEWKCPYPGCMFNTTYYPILKKHFQTHPINPCPLCGKRVLHATHFKLSRDPAHHVFYCLLKHAYQTKAITRAQMFQIAKEACCNA